MERPQDRLETAGSAPKRRQLKKKNLSHIDNGTATRQDKSESNAMVESCPSVPFVPLNVAFIDKGAALRGTSGTDGPFSNRQISLRAMPRWRAARLFHLSL